MNLNENILSYVSKCVTSYKMISSSDTIIDFGVKFDIFDFCIVGIFLLKTFISKTTSLRYVYDKVPSAK